MQVHKETIDKVPNSQPSRGNIEIEIYGMEGIPEADLKAHENSRGQSPQDDDDEPGAKHAKSESPALGTPPLQVGPQMPPALQGQLMASIPGQQQMVLHGIPGLQLPGGLQGVPQLRHPFMTTQGLAGMQLQGVQSMVMPGQVPGGPQATVQYSGQPTGPGGSRLIGFPGTAPATVTSQGAKPTFPAYGQSGNDEPKKPALIATTGSSSKIVHPPEDISLEERRADMPKYREQFVSTQEQQLQQFQLPSGTQQLQQQQQQQQQQLAQLQQQGHPAMQGLQLPPGSMPSSMSASMMQPTSLASIMSVGGMMVGGQPGQFVMAGGVPSDQQQQLLQLQHQLMPRPSLGPGMMLTGQGVQLGGVPGLPGVQVAGMPAMQGLVTSQPQLFARPPMLGLPGQQVMLAGGGQVMMGGGLPGHLQMQVQPSPFGPMLGAMPRFR